MLIGTMPALNFSNFTEKYFEALESLPCLEELSLMHCPYLNSDQIIKILKNCPRLKTLVLPGSEYSDQVLEAISNYCPQLEFLNINHSHFTSKGFEHLARLEYLKTIHLVYGLIDHLGMIEICKCIALRELGLHAESPDFNLSQEIPNFHQMLSLEKLIVIHFVNDTDMEIHAKSCPRLRYIVLNGSGISDIGLAALSKLPLYKLELFMSCALHGNVTDNGLRQLAEDCHTLEILYLPFALSITIEGIKAVVKANPRLHTLQLFGCEILNEDLVKLISENPRFISVIASKGAQLIKNEK